MSFKETYNIDAAQAERALKALKEADERLGKSAEETTKRLSAEDKAARRLAEAADPMKKFNRQVEETAQLVAKGKVSIEDAATVVGKWQQRLDVAGKTQEATFGQRAVSQLASYAAGFVSLQAGAGFVVSIFSKIKEEASAAAERIKASLDAIGELQQIEDFQGNTEFVKKLRQQGVVKDAAQGAALANNLDQAGFNQQEQNFLAFELIKSRFLDANSGADVATKFAKVNDLLQIGDLKTTINKIVQAGGSTSSTNPEFADAMTIFAGQFKGLGYNADESMAAAEIADKNSKNILAAAERLKSFADQVSKRQLGTGSFMGDINSIRKRVQDGENIYAILGEANAVVGYQLFDEDREQAKYRKSMGLVASAADRNVLGNQLGGIYKDPKYAAAIGAQAARGSLEVEQEDRNAELILLHQEATDAWRLYHERQGNRGRSAMVGMLGGFDRMTMEEDYRLKYLLSQEKSSGDFGKESGMLSTDLENRMVGYLERMANNTDPQSKASAE